MGGSSSKSKSFNGDHEIVEKFDIIDDRAINKVLHDNKADLEEGDKALLREAMSRSTGEWRSTLTHCELRINLSNDKCFILRAGSCTNHIVVNRDSNGQIEWNFTVRSCGKMVHDTGKALNPLFKSLYETVGQKAIEFVAQNM